MKRNIITAAVAVSLVAGICVAEETEEKKSKDSSIRITLGSAPGVDEGEISGDISGSGPIGDDGGARLEVMWAKRFWSKNNPNIGGMFGAGLFFGGHNGEDGASSIEITPFGAIIQGGVAFKAGDIVVFEVSPYLGLGIAGTDTVIEGVGDFTDGTGPYALIGIKGGVFAQLSESIELGLELGYESFAMEQEYEYLTSNFDITYEGSGAHVAAVLAVKF